MVGWFLDSSRVSNMICGASERLAEFIWNSYAMHYHQVMR